MAQYTGKIFGSFKGRKFGAWIDADSRSNGYNSGDLIENPAYIIESLIRDELLAEKILDITSVTSTTVMVCDGLLSAVDDHYVGAYYYNRITGHSTTITDYVASTKSITLSSADSGASAGDTVDITSIKYSEKIDYASFDAVGNTTNGKRAGWKFARSIDAAENSLSIISRICYESHCMLFETSEGKYRLVALDADTATTNLIDESMMVSEPVVKRTPSQYIFNRFFFGYHHNYATSAFDRSIVCSEKESGFESFTQLITNGEFVGSSVTGWSDYGTGSRLGASGEMVVTSSAANDGTYQTAAISFKKNRTYLITLDFTITTGTWKIRLPKTASHSGTVIGGSSEQTLSGTSLTYRFTATEDATAYFLLYCSDSGTNNITVDDVKCRNLAFDPTTFTPDESTALIAYGGSGTESLCGISQSRFRFVNRLEEYLLWIYDQWTAFEAVKKLIGWLFAPKITINIKGWNKSFGSTTVSPMLRYELGDQLKLDHPILDPDISNSYIFMVVGKGISSNEQVVTLNLMQMR